MGAAALRTGKRTEGRTLQRSKPAPLLFLRDGEPVLVHRGLPPLLRMRSRPSLLDEERTPLHVSIPSSHKNATLYNTPSSRNFASKDEYSLSKRITNLLHLCGRDRSRSFHPLPPLPTVNLFPICTPSTPSPLRKKKESSEEGSGTPDANSSRKPHRRRKQPFHHYPPRHTLGTSYQPFLSDVSFFERKSFIRPKSFC